MKQSAATEYINFILDIDTSTQLSVPQEHRS